MTATKRLKSQKFKTTTHIMKKIQDTKYSASSMEYMSGAHVFALAMTINCRAALYIVSKLSMLLYGFVVSMHNCPRGQMNPFAVDAIVPSLEIKPETFNVVELI
jgi:hypothetical protein